MTKYNILTYEYSYTEKKVVLTQNEELNMVTGLNAMNRLADVESIYVTRTEDVQKLITALGDEGGELPQYLAFDDETEIENIPYLAYTLGLIACGVKQLGEETT